MARTTPTLTAAALALACATAAPGTSVDPGAPVAPGAPAATATPTPPTPGAAADATPPRLLVLLSVDQLPAYLVARYDSLFTGAFRRLLDDGVVFTDATHDHAATETGPGHATLGTGVYPSHSGIVANDWLMGTEPGAARMYCVEDTSVAIVGAPGEQGRSPRNLLHSGFADWLVARYPAARAVSVSGKDRSAILMLGKAHGQAYWFDHATGRFVSSTYYMDTLPAWVSAFQEERLPTLLGDSVWRDSVPARWRPLTEGDTATWEGDGVHSAFPHRFADEGRHGRPGAFAEWVGGTPFVDRAVLGLARAAIANDHLGADDVPDYLSVGLSQTDYVGHGYGPFSREQLDNLLRLDRELGDFFAYLDRTVGRGRWVAVLSADHGVLPQPEVRERMGEPGRRVSSAELRQALQAARAAEAGDDAAAGAAGEPSAAAQERAASAAERFDFVADAITYRELESGAPADSFVTLFRHSFRRDRVPDAFGSIGIEIRLQPGDILSGAPRGTTHGSPYHYDRWVPLIFLGDGIPAARVRRHVATVDIAPTLARLAGVPVPDDLDGRAILDADGAPSTASGGGAQE